MIHKLFSERLNYELDNIDVPKALNDRVEALSKLLKIPRFKAEAFLTGQMLPDEETFKALTEELEVHKSWLLGEDEVQ